MPSREPGIWTLCQKERSSRLEITTKPPFVERWPYQYLSAGAISPPGNVTTMAPGRRSISAPEPIRYRSPFKPSVEVISRAHHPPIYNRFGAEERPDVELIAERVPQLLAAAVPDPANISSAVKPNGIAVKKVNAADFFSSRIRQSDTRRLSRPRPHRRSRMRAPARRPDKLRSHAPAGGSSDRCANATALESRPGVPSGQTVTILSCRMSCAIAGAGKLSVAPGGKRSCASQNIPPSHDATFL